MIELLSLAVALPWVIAQSFLDLIAVYAVVGLPLLLVKDGIVSLCKRFNWVRQ